MAIKLPYKKIKTDEIRKQFPNTKDYMIHIIKMFGSCGVADWYKNLEDLDFSIIRIIFVLLMENNKQQMRINRLIDEVEKLEVKLGKYESRDDF